MQTSSSLIPYLSQNRLLIVSTASSCYVTSCLSSSMHISDGLVRFASSKHTMKIMLWDSQVLSAVSSTPLVTLERHRHQVLADWRGSSGCLQNKKIYGIFHNYCGVVFECLVSDNGKTQPEPKTKNI